MQKIKGKDIKVHLAYSSPKQNERNHFGINEGPVQITETDGNGATFNYTGLPPSIEAAAAYSKGKSIELSVLKNKSTSND